MKFKILACFLVIESALSIAAVEIDFSSGGYNVKKEDIKDKIKYEHRSAEEIEADHQKAKGEKRQAEREKIFAKQPWRKIIFKRDKIVIGDFVNASSNSLVITVLDRERIKRENVKDPETIRKNYSLNLMLLPGDKYQELNEDENGLRLATYAWAHRKREQRIREYTLDNIMKFDEDRDGLSFYEESIGTNIVLNLEEGEKEIWASTEVKNKDSDQDGLSDFEEIKGCNGFVTDPLDPDTDKDGIPDGADKNPLIKCKSDDPNLMPQEWVDYLSKGDVEKAKLLKPSEGDPDGDGIANCQEMILQTDPLTEDKECFIYFPKNLLLRYDGKGIYSCDFNMFVNRQDPAICQLWTDSDGYGNKMNIEHLKIKHISSHPLGWKPSPMKKLFSQYKFKTKYMAARVEPKTIHTFRVIYDSKNISAFRYANVHASLSELGNNPESRDGFMYPFFKGQLRIKQNCFEPRSSCINDKDYYPSSPKLLYPPDDFVYETFTNNFFNYQEISEKYREMGWKSALKILPVRILKPNDGGIGFKNLYSLPNNKKEKIPKISDFNEHTCLWFIALTDPVLNHCMVYSDIRIMFKKDKISEDHPLVFKGNTEEEILEEIEKRYNGTVVK